MSNDEAARLIGTAPMVTDVDRTLGNALPFQDISITQDPHGTNLFRVPAGVVGLGLTGWLPPGSVVILAPDSDVSIASLAIDIIGQAMLARGNLGTFPTGWLIMRPGDCVNFGRKLQLPLAGVFCIPWDTQSTYKAQRGDPSPYSALSNYFLPSNPIGGYISEFGLYGPAPAPVMRCFTEVGSVPTAINYTRAPYTTMVLTNTSKSTQNFSSGTGNTGANGLPAVAIPPGVRSLTIAAVDDPGFSPVTGGPFLSPIRTLAVGGVAAFDLQVAWWLASGVNHMNPSDQWNAAGRGQASSTHDVEAYQVPGNASGIDIWTPGTQRRLFLTMSEG